MGKMQDTLEHAIQTIGKSVERKEVEYPRRDQVLSSNLSDHVFEMYTSLGGILDTPPVGFRGWDIEADGIAIELDEQLHFNRYRLTTLQSSVYRRLEKFPIDSYEKMCEEFEPDCLRAGHYGGKWTNASCEKQFGPAGQNGDLNGWGAPRWKQRAYYDFVKDLSELLIGVKVVRISIWDHVRISGKSRLVLDLLNRPVPELGSAIWELVESRR